MTGMDTVDGWPVGPGAILRKADLRGTDLRKADLSGANLLKANLAGADLTGADLTGADLGEADLTGANLTGADLTGANVLWADLSGVIVEGATLPVDLRITHRRTDAPTHRLVTVWRVDGGPLQISQGCILAWGLDEFAAEFAEYRPDGWTDDQVARCLELVADGVAEVEDQ